MPFTIAFGEEVYTSRVDYDNEKLYQMLEEFPEIPKSSQITSFTFEEKLIGREFIFMISSNRKTDFLE